MIIPVLLIVAGFVFLIAGANWLVEGASALAKRYKISDLVIGSNIFNILLILSISSLIKPIDYNLKFNLDIYILIGGTVFILASMLTGKRKKLDRWEAGILFGFYIIYTTYLVMNEI